MDATSLRERLSRQTPLLLVTILACAVAVSAYVQFLPNARALWWSPSHDRNAHYWMAQCVGLDLRNADLAHLARDIERMRIWGPTFPLITGLVLAVTGPDYRVAVLSCIAAWVGAALFAFLTARRVAPQGGNFAGFIAAVLVMASPAFHAYATDIMLEGPGACLSLAVLHAYLRARQEPSIGSYRGFALAMTALFLLKCNYWLLALFALLATEACRHLGILVTLGLTMDRAALRSWALAQVRHPLTWLLAVPLGLLGAYLAVGPLTLPFGLRLRSAETLADVAYWLAFVRVFTAWRRVGRPWLSVRSSWATTLVDWHLWPTAAYFLLPKRVALFIWYLTRFHGVGEGEGWLGRLDAYTQALAQDYLPGLAAVAAVALLTVLAFVLGRRLQRGSAFLLWFIAVSAGLTALQATCRSRFLHSWIAATWVTAGVGLALCVYGWRAGHVSRLRHVAAAVLLGVLVLAVAPNALGPGHAYEGGPEPQRAYILPIAEELLPRLDGARRVAIVSTHSLSFFVSWTEQERGGRTERVIGAVHQLPADPADFATWAERSRCDAIVWLDATVESPLYFPAFNAEDGRLPELLARQTVYSPAERLAWPALGCWAQIWRRSAP